MTIERAILEVLFPRLVCLRYGLPSFGWEELGVDVELLINRFCFELYWLNMPIDEFTTDIGIQALAAIAAAWSGQRSDEYMRAPVDMRLQARQLADRVLVLARPKLQAYSSLNP